MTSNHSPSAFLWPTAIRMACGLFPGWFVKNGGNSFKELWVLEPKAFGKFLANEQEVMAPEDVKLAAFHLSRFIREQERMLEARK